MTMVISLSDVHVPAKLYIIRQNAHRQPHYNLKKHNVQRS